MNKHAYLIIAHNDVYLLKKLVNTLDAPYNDIYIHFDTKTYTNEINTIKTRFSKLKVISELSLNWGSYSIIECELKLLGLALEEKHSYYHLLSGADLPIKSVDTIYKFFESSKKEFILFSENNFPAICEDWVYYHHICAEKFKTKKTKIGNKLVFWTDSLSVTIQKLLRKRRNLYFNNHQKGSQWFSITEDFAAYVVSLKDIIMTDFADSYIPDEIVIQTILINSKWKDNLYRADKINSPEQNSRYIDWERGRPYTFGIDDQELLCNSVCMFARKFSSSHDKRIIDVLSDKNCYKDN